MRDLVAFECVDRIPAGYRVRRAGGGSRPDARVLYDQAEYKPDRVTLVDSHTNGFSRVDPSTVVELVRPDGTVEPNPRSVLGVK